MRRCLCSFNSFAIFHVLLYSHIPRARCWNTSCHFTLRWHCIMYFYVNFFSYQFTYTRSIVNFSNYGTKTCIFFSLFCIKFARHIVLFNVLSPYFIILYIFYCGVAILCAKVHFVYNLLWPTSKWSHAHEYITYVSFI